MRERLDISGFAFLMYLYQLKNPVLEIATLPKFAYDKTENHIPDKVNQYQKTIDLETVTENPCPKRHKNKKIF